MSNITKISQLNEVTEEVYSKFFFDSYNNNKFDVDIVCNNKNKSGKATSFSFNPVIPTLRSYFDIPDSKTIEGEAFDKVCRNLGLEKKRILTLDSSALLVLLVFYKVNEYNPIVIEGIKYNKVMFEVKNEVVEGDRAPSRVDALLVSDDEKTLLFLESKFTEPLNRGKVTKLSEAYGKYYKKIKFDEIKGSDGIGQEYIQDPKNQTFTIKKKNTRNTNQYCAGIKQMISHFIGLCKGPVKDNPEEYVELFNKKAEKLILGEILFEFPKPDYKGMQAKIDDYKTLYAGLAKVLNDNKEKFKDVPEIKNDKKRVKNIDKISVVEAALTYQDILKDNPTYELDDIVSHFYHFDNDRE